MGYDMNRMTTELSLMIEKIDKLPTLNFDELDKNKTVLMVVDMVNGFAKKGNLYSPRIESVIPQTVELTKKCMDNNMPVVAFCDNHTENSPELFAYINHCMAGTDEPEVIEEISSLGELFIVNKNSTNGFHVLNLEDMFMTTDSDMKYLYDCDTFVVVGDCTDICVDQLAKSLKTYFNEHDRPSRVIVPVNAVETFDMPGHSADLMNLVFLNSMISNGIEVVKNIK